MRTAFARYCLAVSVSASLPALSHGSLSYSAKREGAEIYRSEKLDPPPLAGLAKGQAVTLVNKGSAASLIESEGGIRGWIRNEDLVAMSDPNGQAFRLQDIDVLGDPDFNHSFHLNHSIGWTPDFLPIDRGFMAEVPETLDKEQVEMRHDEN